MSSYVSRPEAKAETCWLTPFILGTSAVCIQLGWENVNAYLGQHRNDTAVTFFSLSAQRLFAATPYHGAIEWRSTSVVRRVIFFSIHPEGTFYIASLATGQLLDSIWNYAATMARMEASVNVGYFAWKTQQSRQASRGMNWAVEPVEAWQFFVDKSAKDLSGRQTTWLIITMRAWEKSSDQHIPHASLPKRLLDIHRGLGLELSLNCSVPHQILSTWGSRPRRGKKRRWGIDLRLNKGHQARRQNTAFNYGPEEDQFLLRLREQDKLSFAQIVLRFASHRNQVLTKGALWGRFVHLRPNTVNMIPQTEDDDRFINRLIEEGVPHSEIARRLKSERNVVVTKTAVRMRAYRRTGKAPSIKAKMIGKGSQTRLSKDDRDFLIRLREKERLTFSAIALRFKSDRNMVISMQKAGKDYRRLRPIVTDEAAKSSPSAVISEEDE